MSTISGSQGLLADLLFAFLSCSLGWGCRSAGVIIHSQSPVSASSFSLMCFLSWLFRGLCSAPGLQHHLLVSSLCL